jgi:phospholipase/lecithinase/hemolysin
VIDMEAAYRRHAAEHLFFEDVLHPTQEGHDLEAEVLYERLVAEKVLPLTTGGVAPLSWTLDRLGM